MRKPNTRGIYIHIPFCRSKCPYCDFYSTPRAGARDIEDFVRALEAEIRFYSNIYGRGAEQRKTGGAPAGAAAVPQREAASSRQSFAASPQQHPQSLADRTQQARLCGTVVPPVPPPPAALPIDSIYFGGGTPSILSEAQFDGVMRVLTENFEICTDAEVSMEANPATVTEAKLAAYKAAGLNRLSIGAQSFDPAVLKLLGRLHKPEHTAEAVEAARKAGIKNISLDLMFGIFGQTAASWEQTVRQAAALRPQHVSLYTLEIADGTRFARDLDRGIYRQTDEETDRKMYETALKLLAEAGLHQYEISNASIEGFECRHNLRYWSMDEYLGFGPSAHSFVGGMRYSNPPDTAEYTARGLAAEPPQTENIHVNTEQDNISEYMFTGLRRTAGIDSRDFKDNFGRELWEVFADERAEFEAFVRGGFVEEDETGLRLTQAGMNISNRIMLLFV